MKNLFKILILPIAILTMLGGFADKAFALDPASLVVVFNPNPLFNKLNFLPGDEASGEATVTNNSGATQNILTEAINVSDNDNFGSLLHLNISGGTLYDDSLADFFSTAGEVPLGSILNGESKTFTYTISFINSSDNSYQGKTLGFDICVGFEGGTTHCGDTVVDDEGGGIGGDPGGGIIPGTGGGGTGGGGGGNGPPVPTPLSIFNEQALTISNVGQSGSVTITWDTNLLATSQVIYGPTPPTYSLDMGAVFFGYPLGTAEDTTKILHHSMSLTGLTPGQTYVYRVVSRASPPTISFEHQFTVPLLAQTGSNNFTGGSPSGGAGSGSTSGGVSVSNTSQVGGLEGNSETSPAKEGAPTTLENATSTNANLATAFFSGFGDLLSICTLISILILLAIYLIWKFWLRKRYEKEGVPEEEILNRFYLFFGGSSLIALLICVAISQYCPIPVFLTSFIISICIYAFRRLK